MMTCSLFEEKRGSKRFAHCPKSKPVLFSMRPPSPVCTISLDLHNNLKRQVEQVSSFLLIGENKLRGRVLFCPWCHS